MSSLNAGQRICEALGLSPQRVTSVTLHVSVESPLPMVTITRFEFDRVDELCQTLRQFVLIPADGAKTDDDDLVIAKRRAATEADRAQVVPVSAPAKSSRIWAALFPWRR